MSLCIFTVVARNYIPLALTLADSVRQHHPEADLRIFVADGTTGLPDGAMQQVRHALTSLDDVLDASFEELRFKYNITEFCTAVKPHLFQRLLAETQAEVVYYLDPDTWLFGRLDALHGAAPHGTLFLTPHLLHCRPLGDHAYPEYKHLWEGIFNLGFCAIRRTPLADTVLAWWDQRLREHCYADHFDGLHTDQKWMDYAPAYFGDALHIVRLQGVNVAHWNLDERTLTHALHDPQDPQHLEAPPGRRVNGEPLLLWHFSGFDFQGRLLTRHATPELQLRYLSPAVLQLAADYRQAVLTNGFASFIGLPYRYNHYDNGQPVTPLHRRLYRALGGAAALPAPFSSAGPLYRQLQARRLLDDSTAALQSHAAATLPSVGRLTTVARVLLRAFLRLAGARRYAYLLKFFYKFAKPEAHAFLLADANTAASSESRTRP